MIHTSKETERVRPYTRLLQEIIDNCCRRSWLDWFLQNSSLGHAVRILLTAVVAYIFDVGDINFKLLRIKYECIATG